MNQTPTTTATAPAVTIKKGTDPLPGVRSTSDLRRIFNDLMAGRVLTGLDAVKAQRTICLTTYISRLRKQYGIPVQAREIEVAASEGRTKRVNEYWITAEDRQKIEAAAR